MPIIKSAKKQMRQDKRRYAQNLRVKRDLRVAVKAFETKPTFDGLKTVQSKLDTAVKKNIIKKNTGARKMARFSALAKKSGVKITAKKTAPAKVSTKNATIKTTVAKKAPAKK